MFYVTAFGFVGCILFSIHVELISLLGGSTRAVSAAAATTACATAWLDRPPTRGLSTGLVAEGPRESAERAECAPRAGESAAPGDEGGEYAKQPGSVA